MKFLVKCSQNLYEKLDQGNKKDLSMHYMDFQRKYYESYAYNVTYCVKFAKFRSMYMIINYITFVYLSFLIMCNL